MADFPQKTLDRYDELVAKHGFQRKGASSAYTSLNGHMFSFLFDGGCLALRLSKEDREAFVAKHKTRPVEVYRTIMKEYVRLPAKMLGNARTASSWFAKSVEYVSSLKPRPTTRKKKATGKAKSAKKKAAGKAKAAMPRKKASVKKARAKATRKKPSKTARKKSSRKAKSAKRKTG